MNRTFPESLFRTLPVAATLIGCTLSLAAQQPSMPNAAAQRDAMKKLAFLAGHWSGACLDLARTRRAVETHAD